MVLRRQLAEVVLEAIVDVQSKRLLEGAQLQAQNIIKVIDTHNCGILKYTSASVLFSLAPPASL
jgi:hypothetical protein